MSEQDQPGKDSGLYSQLLTRLRERLEAVDEKSLDSALAHVKETAKKLGVMSHQEVDRAIVSLKRDITAAVNYLEATQKELSTWLRFDISLIEERFWETFSTVADRSRIDEVTLQYQIIRGPAYHVGEMIGLGSLQCDSCGDVTDYHHSATIQKCKKCQGKEFSRVSSLDKH